MADAEVAQVGSKSGRVAEGEALVQLQPIGGLRQSALFADRPSNRFE